MTESRNLSASDLNVGNFSEYSKLYENSLQDPEAFWSEQARRIDWFEPFTKLKDCHFEGNAHVKWFIGGKLNVSYNCLDRHLEKKGDQTAIIFEGDDPGVTRKITYKQLHEEVCKFANVLKSNGVKKGDRVSIYLPMIPQLAVAALACARIGAVHVIVFAGFSADALAERMRDSGSAILVTSDEGLRGSKRVPIKANADAAMKLVSAVKTCIVVKHTGGAANFTEGRDKWWDDEMAKANAVCEPEKMDAEDPLFILYAAGDSGKPKGVVHSSGGYLVYVSLTHRAVFGYREGDVHWATADIGWITGHSYILYGPLANGATTVLFEGVPSYPDFGRFWEVCDKHQVNILYTAPTAIRVLMQEGDAWVKKYSRKSLKLFATVGEPLNPEAWKWFYEVVGEKRCQIVDTWWQTETGGILISLLPGDFPMKPGSWGLPFLGLQPALVTPEGEFIEGAGEGHLVFKDSWPGQVRTIFGDPEQFDLYFARYPGLYFTGDGAQRDEDGYYHITGRVDDVINVSGHRMGTSEIEKALTAHQAVAEAAVVGFPHNIKGQGICAYITLAAGHEFTDALRKELVTWVRKEIGPIATPDIIHPVPQLPKTQAGVIKRDVLRKLEGAEFKGEEEAANS